MPLTEYAYSIKTVDSNWPVVVNSISGTIIPRTTSAELETILEFCASSGSCPALDVLPYNFDACSDTNVPSVDFFIELSLPYSDMTIRGDTHHVECPECLQKPSIANIDPIFLSYNTSNIVDLEIPVNNLKYYSTYNYVFEILESNTLFALTHLSGTIDTLEKTNDLVKTKIVFCETSGDCSGYNILGSVEQSCMDEDSHVKFRLKLSSDCLNNDIYSEDIIIYCDKCYPKPIFDIPLEVSLTDTNQYDLSFTVNNIKKHTPYSYTVVDIDTNTVVGFKNLSGSFDSVLDFKEVINTVVFCDTTGFYPGYNFVGTSGACVTSPEVKFKINLDSDCLMSPIISEEITLKCDDCLPQRHLIDFPMRGLYHQYQSIDISGIVSNLIPKRSYYYEFESILGDSPINIDPVSGIFTTKNDSYTIESQALFCCPTGSCNGTIFPKTYSNLGFPSEYSVNYLKHELRLNVTDLCSDHREYQDSIIYVELKDIEIKPENDTINIVLDSVDTCYNLRMLVDNCLKEYSYNYYYHITDGNWPILLDNVSGVFTNREPTVIIDNTITFCPSTGLCSDRPNALFPSNIKSRNLLNNLCQTSSNKYATIVLSVYSDCYPNAKVFDSEPITVYIEDNEHTNVGFSSEILPK